MSIKEIREILDRAEIGELAAAMEPFYNDERSGVVKLLAIAVPAVIVIAAFCLCDVGVGLLSLGGAIVWYVVVWAVARFLDGTFGVLVSEDEIWMQE